MDMVRAPFSTSNFSFYSFIAAPPLLPSSFFPGIKKNI